MQRSDTTLVEAIGLGMGSVSHACLAHRYGARGARCDTKLSQPGCWCGGALAGGTRKILAQLIELMKKLPREQDVTVAILRWAGEPLLPAQ